MSTKSGSKLLTIVPSIDGFQLSDGLLVLVVVTVSSILTGVSQILSFVVVVFGVTHDLNRLMILTLPLHSTISYVR